MKKTEREAIEAIGQAIRTAERNLRRVREINAKAGRNRVANAVFGLEGKLMVWHSEATEALHQMWPEAADDIQVLGGDR